MKTTKIVNQRASHEDGAPRRHLASIPCIQCMKTLSSSQRDNGVWGQKETSMRIGASMVKSMDKKSFGILKS